MQVRLLQACRGHDGCKCAGQIIEHPRAWQLVVEGRAEALDDEARQAVEKHQNASR